MTQQQISSRYSPGDIFDARYTIISVLGQGGMAEVYLVEDTKRDNRRYALKLLMPHISNNPVNVERFKREILIMESLESPNIVKSHYYEVSKKNEHFIIMEYVEGQSLSKVLKDKGKIDYNDVYKYLIQVLKGLSTAHIKKFIHRDIKPDNIMLTSDGIIKIADFGIAKDLNTSKEITELANAAASVHYKAPELYNDNYDHTVDFYSLGITVYELLTNAKPFDAEKNIQILMQHQTKEIPQLKLLTSGVPDFFQEFIEICCEKNPKKRFKNAEEALKFLNSHRKEISDSDFSEYLISNYTFFEKHPSLKRALRKTNKFLSGVFLKYFVSLIVACLVVLLYTQHNNNPKSIIIGDKIDLAILDMQYGFRPNLETPKDIVIVAIDEKSYRKFEVAENQSWPRELFAEFLEMLAKKHPRLVILDYRFPKINKNPNLAVDMRLANALKSTPSILSKFVNPRVNVGRAKDELEFEDSDDLFLKNAKGVYNANLLVSDKVRYFNTGLGTSNGIPPIAEVVLGNEVSKGKFPSPFDMINYIGPPGSIEFISFYDALSSDKYINSDYFDGKIIFIGKQIYVPHENEIKDTFLTPSSDTLMSGVEIHATSASNILKQNWIRRLPMYLEIIILFFGTFVLSYLALSVGIVHCAIFVGLYLVVWNVISYILFRNYLFFPGHIIVIGLLSTMVTSFLRYYYLKKMESRVLGIT
jgi:serine/threonine protein kinase